MANASNSFEDFLPIDFDVSAVNDLVGTLDSQLSSPATKDLSQTVSEKSTNSIHFSNGSNPVNSNHLQNSHQVAGSVNITQVNIARPGSAGPNTTQTQLINNSQIKAGVNSASDSTGALKNSVQMTRTNHVPQHVLNSRVPSPHQAMGSPVNNTAKQYSPTSNRSLTSSPMNNSPMLRTNSPLTYNVSVVPSPKNNQGLNVNVLTENNRVATPNLMQTTVNMQPQKQIVIKSLDPQIQASGNVHILNIASKNSSISQNVVTNAQSLSLNATNIRPSAGYVGQKFNAMGKVAIRSTGSYGPVKIAAAPSQVNIAPRPLNTAVTAVSTPSTITIPGYQLPAGTMFIRNDQGQVVLIQTNQASGLSIPNKVIAKNLQVSPSPRPTTQTPTVLPAANIVRVCTPQTITQAQAVPAQSTATSTTSTTASSSHMEHVKKCKNFLSTLLKLASSQAPQTIKNVRELIQKLIDGKMEPELFTEELQVELKSSPQPNLVLFLKKSLPLLRQSLASKEMTIDGVRAPQVTIMPLSSTSPRTPQPIGQPSAIPGGHTHMQLIRPISVQQMQQIRTAAPHKSVAILPNKTGKSPAAIKPLLTSQTRPVTASRHPVATGTHDKRKFESLKEDDDINDVATMGGVNLTEESRNILATNSDLVGTQERSCTEESFLYHDPLIARISSIGKKLGIEFISPDVATFISHATQERLRNIAERLSVVTEHRSEIYKVDPKYESSTAIRSQLKFLDELDKLEKKRHGEQEREMLLRAAKSRSKTEDPEQVKLKQKAKELQQAEMEEARQREANLTALAAIGPRRKKLKEPTEQQQGSSADSSPFSTPRPVPSRQRVKRVTLKDLLFILEQERASARSQTLYKTFLK